MLQDKSQLRMPKRKSSIFTVAESIHNWFEASDPNLFQITKGESHPSWPGSNGTPADHAASDKWAVDQPRANPVLGPRDEAHKGCGKWTEVDVAPTVWTEAKEVPATCTEVTGQLAYELAKGVD